LLRLFFLIGFLPCASMAEFAQDPAQSVRESNSASLMTGISASSLGSIKPASNGFYGGQSDFLLDGRAGINANGNTTFAGYQQVIGNEMGWDAGVSLYRSPDERLENFTELYGGLSYKIFRTRLAFARDYFGTSGYRAHLEAGMNVTVGDGYDVGFHVGRSSFNTKTGLRGFTGYRLNLSREYEGFGIGLDLTHSGYNRAATEDDASDHGVLGDSSFNFTITRDF